MDGSYDTAHEPLTHTIQLDRSDDDIWSKKPNTMHFPSNGTPEMTVCFTTPEGMKAYHFSPTEPFEANQQVCIRGTYVDDAIEPEIPVAGGTYKGYYVISVNESQKTAVLLSKTQEKGYSDAAAVNNALTAWPTPEGLTGTWRFPTVAELTTWFNDRNAITLENGKWVKYYCKDGNGLTTLELIRSYAGNYTIKGPATEFIGPSAYLAPVIDISW